MKLRLLYFLVLSLLITIHIFSQIKVEIGMPKLGEGMEHVEVLLYSNIGSAVGDLELIATEALIKPELTKAFSNSVGINRPISIINNSSNISKYSFSIGTSFGIYSKTFEYNDLEEKFSGFQPEDDIEFGINAQLINTSLTIPYLLFSFSYLDINTEEYFMLTTSGTLSYGIVPIKKIQLSYLFNWIPISLQTGYSYGFTKLGVIAEAGVITEEFDFDVDGDGPLFGQSIGIEINPVVKVGLDSNIGVLSLIGSTGINLLDFLHLSLGGGINLSHGSTDISVNSLEEITVLGFLSGLIEEPGSVSISGSVKGGAPEMFIGYLFSSLQIDISTMFLNIGALYSVPKGLSIGIAWGLFY